MKSSLIKTLLSLASGLLILLHDVTAASREADSSDAELKPVREILTHNSFQSRDDELDQTLVARQALCRLWYSSSGRRAVAELSPSGRLAGLMRQLCDKPKKSSSLQRGNSEAVSYNTAKRFESFDDYGDDSVDGGSESTGGGKGSWRRNVMRVWG